MLSARAGAVGVTGAGGATGVVVGDPGAEGTGDVSAVSGGAARPRPYYVSLLQQVLGPSPPLLSPPPVQSQLQLQPASPLPHPSPNSGPTRGLAERREPEYRPVSPESRSASPVRTVRAGRRVSCPRPPPVPGTHSITLRPSTAPQRIPLPSPPTSSLLDGPDPESDSLRAPTCHLDYATSLVAESESASVCPPSIGGECALGTDILEDKQEEFECFAAAVPHLVSMVLAPEGDPDAPDIPTRRSFAKAITGPYSSQWQAVMDAEMASWKSTRTYGEATTPSTWLRRPPGFTGSFPAGTQWSLRRPIYGLRQATREWHDTLRTTLAALGFAPSTADPSLFLRTDTTLPPFYVLVYVDDLVFATADTEALAHVKSELQKRHTCIDLAPPSDESEEPSGPYPELLGCLITSGMGLVLGGRARVVLTGHADASWVDDLATERSSQGYTFSLGSESVSWQSTRSSSVLSSSCEAEIYAGAMAAQELRLLTYLLTNLGEAPRSPPVLYANTADVFAEAIQPCDHQRFCTVLGLVPTVPHLLTS
ncbi:unnamed protein product [Closterium sp. NIES-53]